MSFPTNQQIAKAMCKMIGHMWEDDPQSQKRICKRCGEEE
jgi:hypothetical protein